MSKSILFCVIYAIFNVSGATIIKTRLKGQALEKADEWIAFLFQGYVIFALMLVFLSALFMFKALSMGQISLVIPVATGVNFIFTVAIGYFVFKDVVNMQTIIGFALILSGIALLSIKKT